MVDINDPGFVLAKQASEAATGAVKPFLLRAAPQGSDLIIRIMFCSIGGLLFLMHDMLTLSGMSSREATDFMFKKMRHAHEIGVRGANKANADFEKMVNVPTEPKN